MSLQKLTKDIIHCSQSSHFVLVIKNPVGMFAISKRIFGRESIVLTIYESVQGGSLNFMA